MTNPNLSIRLVIDGVAAVTQIFEAADNGSFSLAFREPLSAGSHTFDFQAEVSTLAGAPTASANMIVFSTP
jgi:hypothetical protein